MGGNHAVTKVSRAAVLVALAAAAVAVSGCTNSGSEQNANLVNGKKLFVEKCGSCHTLNRAGTKGVVGPNLDAAFNVARHEGWGSNSIRGVVLGQIGFPGRGTTMPANLVKGDDAKDVAAYVAAVAAQGGKDGGLLANASADPNDPKAVFVQNCGSCHTLAAAGTTGKTGPNLDTQLAKSAGVPQITEMIAKPNADIAPGYQAGIMPQDFASSLGAKRLAALAAYINKSSKHGG